MKSNKIELLNSEGPILTANKVLNEDGSVTVQLDFNVAGQKQQIELTETQLKNFILGKTRAYACGREWYYPSFSEGMKPSFVDFDKFIDL